MAKTAIDRTLDIIAPDGAWHGDNKKTAKAKWFLARCKKRDRRAKLQKASRKRNRR